MFRGLRLTQLVSYLILTLGASVSVDVSSETRFPSAQVSSGLVKLRLGPTSSIHRQAAIYHHKCPDGVYRQHLWGAAAGKPSEPFELDRLPRMWWRRH